MKSLTCQFFTSFISAQPSVNKATLILNHYNSNLVMTKVMIVGFNSVMVAL